MFALHQIIKYPQNVVVKTKFCHCPIEIIFIALDLNATKWPAQNTIKKSKILWENWFENYKI